MRTQLLSVPLQFADNEPFLLVSLWVLQVHRFYDYAAVHQRNCAFPLPGVILELNLTQNHNLFRQGGRTF